MMKSCFCEKVNKKFGSKAGETISETLVALLISALALAMLAGAITAAIRIINRETTKLDNYYTVNEEIVNQDNAALMSNNGKVTISLKNKDSETAPEITTTAPITVDCYENGVFDENDPVISYKQQ